MFIMPFSWLVHNSYLCQLLAVAPYQSTGWMNIFTLQLNWHLKTNWAHLAHKKSPSLQKWQTCIHWWQRLQKLRFCWTTECNCFSRTTSQCWLQVNYWINYSHTLWVALERQGVWQDPSEVEGRYYEMTAKDKVLLSDCNICPSIAAMSAPGKAMCSFSWSKFSYCWLVNTTQNNPLSRRFDQLCVLYVLQLLAEIPVTQLPFICCLHR